MQMIHDRRATPIPARRIPNPNWQQAEKDRLHRLAERATERRRQANHGQIARGTWLAPCPCAGEPDCPDCRGAGQIDRLAVLAGRLAESVVAVPRAVAQVGDRVGYILPWWGGRRGGGYRRPNGSGIAITETP